MLCVSTVVVVRVRLSAGLLNAKLKNCLGNVVAAAAQQFMSNNDDDDDAGVAAAADDDPGGTFYYRVREDLQLVVAVYETATLE